ncbi:MAG: hypothetical protein OHK0023_00450 [Anaerolineae bacterium]
MKLLTLLLLVTIILIPPAFGTKAQPPEGYDDGRFSLPLPSGWTNQSTAERAHFTSADGRMAVYAQSLVGTDTRGSANALVAELIPNLSEKPLQINEIPLPNGLIWVQQVYLLADGRLIAALSTTVEQFTYVFVAIGEQTVFIANQAVINKLLFDLNIKSIGTGYVTPSYADPSKFMEMEGVVVSGDFRLPATIALPKDAQNVPAVVLVNGSGPQDRNGQIGPNRVQQDLAWGLATLGIASIRYDERTYSQPEKLTADLTIDHEVTDDALAAAILLRSTPGIDPKRIYIVGHSLGGMMAPRMAERDPELAGLVLLAGNARPFEDLLDEQIAYLSSLTPTLSEEQRAAYAELTAFANHLRLLRAGGDTSGIPAEQLPYLRSIAEYDQVATAQKIAQPMLILQGERDYQVTMADFALWQTSLAAKQNVTLKSYPSLNHLFFVGVGKATPSEYGLPGHVDQQVIVDIAEWIKRH